jgi:hypothetical protein
MWFRVGSLALPQKMNLHNHIFRKALYSTSDKGPSDIKFWIYLLYPNPYFHSCLSRGALVLVWIHSSCDSQAGYHVYIGQSGGHWPMAKKEGICAIRPKMAGCNQEGSHFWVFQPRTILNSEQC